jgi:hypothetical protein
MLSNPRCLENFKFWNFWNFEIFEIQKFLKLWIFEIFKNCWKFQYDVSKTVHTIILTQQLYIKRKCSTQQIWLWNYQFLNFKNFKIPKISKFKIFQTSKFLKFSKFFQNFKNFKFSKQNQNLHKISNFFFFWKSPVCTHIPLSLICVGHEQPENALTFMFSYVYIDNWTVM